MIYYVLSYKGKDGGNIDQEDSSKSDGGWDGGSIDDD